MKIDFISKIKYASWFFYGAALLLVLGFVLLCICGKSNSFFLLNSFHHPVLDYFFILFTNLGDGIIALVFCVLAIVFYRKKIYALSLFYAFIISGLIAQVLKRMVDAPRPKLYFANGEYTQFIDGIKIATQHSFPSGHSTSAFALFFCLSLLAKNHYVKVFTALCAIAVAYSRVYLSQHFLQDIIGGSFVGISVGFIFYYFMYERKILFKSEKLNKRLKF